MSLEWNANLDAAPFQEVVWVTNDQMQPRKVLATRGLVTESGVHPDTHFFTTVYTPDPDGFFPTPAGRIVCPNKWAKCEEESK